MNRTATLVINQIHRLFYLNVRRRKAFFVKLCASCFCIISLLWMFGFTDQVSYEDMPPSPSDIMTHPKPVQQYTPGYKKILLWTPFFQQKAWGLGNLGDNPFFKCPEKRCTLSIVDSNFISSDLVLFHTRDMSGGARRMPTLSRPANQLWGFVSMESPYHTYSSNTYYLFKTTDLSGYDGMFNWTITYRLDSDVKAIYGSFQEKETPVAINLKEIVSKKSNFVLWFVSNCNTKPTKIRSEFVKQLKKHIKVDVYGKCGQTDPCYYHENKTACTKLLFKSYKFYLAFENSVCKEYVTEKVWNCLKEGIVPVVLGATLQDYENILPPGSFIHVENFTLPKALADYLVYLDNNDDAYQSYFSWTSKYQINSRTSLYCNICSRLHEENHQTPAKKISEFWGIENNCRDVLRYKK